MEYLLIAKVIQKLMIKKLGGRIVFILAWNWFIVVWNWFSDGIQV